MSDDYIENQTEMQLYEARERIAQLERDNATLRGAMKADDERLHQAGERVGIHYEGCHTAEIMADRIAQLERERDAALAQVERLRVALKRVLSFTTVVYQEERDACDDAIAVLAETAPASLAAHDAAVRATTLREVAEILHGRAVGYNEKHRYGTAGVYKDAMRLCIGRGRAGRGGAAVTEQETEKLKTRCMDLLKDDAQGALFKVLDISRLVGEVDRLRAEVAQRSADAELGAMVRRMPRHFALIHNDTERGYGQSEWIARRVPLGNAHDGATPEEALLAAEAEAAPAGEARP